MYTRRSLRSALLAAFALGLPSAVAMDAPRGRESRPRADEPVRSKAPIRVGFLESLPVSFEENRGQGEEGAAYLARGNGWTASIVPAGADFVLGPAAEDRVRMRVRGAREGARVEAVEPLPTRSNYFLGNDPEKWITRVPHAAGLLARDVMPGVALRWRGVAGGKVRYDLEVDAGADASSIALDLEGASSVRAAADGTLVVQTPGGTLRHSAPVAWQEGPSGKTLLPCRFEARGTTVRFAVEGRDPSLPLVIDPTVEVGANLGTNPTRAYGAALDSSGGILVAGNIRFGGYATSGAYQTSYGGYDEAFIARYAPGSSSVQWFTYLGGQFDDRCWALAVDESDAVYAAGYTQSQGFPRKNAFQSTLKGSGDAWVAKLGKGGDTLSWSTLLGGSAQESAQGVAVGADGRAWVVGNTESTDFPLVDAVDSTYSSGEGFITCINPLGNGLLSSTFFGGSDSEILWDVALAEDGKVWVGGYTVSTNFPTQSPVQGSNGGGYSDAALIGLSADGKTVLFSSYLGGADQDEAYDVAVGIDGNPVFAGYAASSDFPTESPSQGSLGGSYDAVVFKLDASAKSLVFSTYLGGASDDVAHAVVVDQDGTILVSGRTRSAGFPTVDAIDGTYSASNDMFLSRFAADGSSLLFSTFMGGTTDEGVYEMASNGSVVAMGGFAYNPSTNGPEARIASVRFLPDPFRGLQVDDLTATSVAFSWTDSHAGAFGVEVQRRSGLGSFSTIASLTAGAEAYEDSTLSEDANYEFRIRGTSAGGNTAWSVGLRVKTPLLAATGIAAIAEANDAVLVTWEDASSVELGYDVLRRAGGLSGDFTVKAQLAAGSQSWLDSTVVPETEYDYFVRTRGPSGATVESEQAGLRTPPFDPTGFSPQVVDDVTVRLNWQDDSSAESGYEIQRRDDGAGGSFATVATVPADSTQHIDGGVSPESQYSWRVRAFNDDGASYWAESGASLTTPPAAPTGLAVEATSAESVRVTWSDQSSSEQSFRLTRRGPGETLFSEIAQPAANSMSFVDDGVLQKRSYTYRLQASGAGGLSRALEDVQVEVPAQLVILKAVRKAARGSKPAQLAVSGRFDPGTEAIDWLAAAEVRVGAVAIPVSSWTPVKGTYRYEEGGTRIDLKPATSGASAVTMSLRVEGPAAEAVDPDGELVVAVDLAGFDATGNAILSDGSFDPRKGKGAWGTPSLTVASMKASIATPGNHKVVLNALFAPSAEPLSEAPDIRISLGGAPAVILDGSLFTEKKGRWLLEYREVTSWDAVLDPARGTLLLKGAFLDFGPLPSGALPFRIELDVGDLRFVDEPVLISNGKSLKY